MHEDLAMAGPPDHSPSSGLSERIAHILRAKGWSARELSRQAGLTETHVTLMQTRMRHGDYRPTDRTLQAIANASGFNYYWLRDGVGDERPKWQVPEVGGEEDMGAQEMVDLVRVVGPSLLRALARLSPEKREAVASLVRTMS